MDSLDLAIIGPPLLAGLLVLLTHVPLGREVLSRGIIFIDLAVAQIAALGVIFVRVAGWEDEGLVMQLVAAGSAVAGALLLHWTERYWREVQEAIIGVVFVLAATGGLLILANNPHGGEHLRDLLAGQILWVGYDQLPAFALFSILLLVMWLVYPSRRGPLRFYLVFALAVTLSVQLVGVYLVFASLIIPALATRGAGHSAQRWGFLLGATAYAVGLATSAVADLPAGPVIVWLLAVFGAGLALLLSKCGVETRSRSVMDS